MSKITRATLKSFIKKNADALFISNKSNFDGMHDMVMETNDQNFRPTTVNPDQTVHNYEYRLGINGAWFVGDSRDYFTAYDDGTFKGYEVSNCCGHFILAIKA